jgi:hypothetical protein
MAYFIFLKYLDSLEDVRKNPHVKFLPKSPCAIFQTSAKFLKSIEIRKKFFLNFGPFLVFDPATAHLPSPPRRPTASRPTWPSPPPSLTCRPRSVVFLPGPTAAAAVSHVRTPPPATTSTPITAGAPTPHHSPPPPWPIPFRRLATPLLLQPYKRVRSLPLLTVLIPAPFPRSLSSSVLRTGVLTAVALTTVAPLLHCLLSSDERTTEFPTSQSPSPAPWSAPLDIGAAGGRAPVSSVPSSMAGPPWIEAGCGPRPVDQVHGFFLAKIIPGNSIFWHFTLRPLIFSNIILQSLISQLSPWNLKNNFRKVLSLRKIHKNNPETSKFHIFPTTTPNLVILAPKFSGSLLLSFYAFI